MFSRIFQYNFNGSYQYQFLFEAKDFSLSTELIN